MAANPNHPPGAPMTLGNNVVLVIMDMAPTAIAQSTAGAGTKSKRSYQSCMARLQSFGFSPHSAMPTVAWSALQDSAVDKLKFVDRCAPWRESLDTQVLLRIGRDCIRMMQRRESKMSGKLGDSPVSNAFSTAATILTLIIFYGIIVVILRYGFGIELWNPFQG